MPNNPKLKERLAVNSPTVVTLQKRLQAYDDQYNPGKKNFMYIFVHEGIECVHYAKEYEEEQLSLYKEGEDLQIVLKQDAGKDYPYMAWTPTEGAEAKLAATPSLSNTTTMAHENNQKTIDQKGTAISLQGYAQQIFPALLAMRSDTEMALIEDEAVAIAKSLKKKVDQAAAEESL